MKITKILFLALTSSILFGCKSESILNDFTFDNPVLSYQQGDTSGIKRSLDSKYYQRFIDTRNSRLAIVLHDTIVKFEGFKLHGQPSQAPDLNNLKTESLKGKPLEYVAFGSSLTAGVRDGGYYNEGILTSYPELIARQMRLENFKSPVFESTDYNGVGRKVITNFNPTQGPIKKYAVVTNNTGIESYDDKLKQPILKKSKYKWEELNNAALPGYRFGISSVENSKSVDIYEERFGRKNIPMVFGDRKLDFFTFEFCSADFTSIGVYEVQAFSMQKGETPVGPLKYKNYVEAAMGTAKERGLKGVFLNVPNHNFFPAYWQIPCGTIETNSKNVITSPDCRNNYVYGNSSRLDTLSSPVVSLNFKTKGFSIPFINNQYEYPLDSYKYSENAFDYFNKSQIELGKKYGFPVVELDKIYEQILAGKYITDDGVMVDPRMEIGNFFSSDGLYPTAFGHAIIANEIIKAINTHYKTRIPLIKTREYLK